MAKKRKQDSNNFKFKVALEAVKRVKTISQLAGEYNLLPPDWQLEKAAGYSLKTGPRDDGRTRNKILAYVMKSDASYLRRLAWKFKPNPGDTPAESLARVRQAVLDALQSAVANGLPGKSPRGDII